jgi:hypothetical protein
MLMSRLLFACAAAVALLCGGRAEGAIRITEWMYSGGSAEFVELTNVGGSPIDMTGWSYDDDSATPGVFSLSDFGIVAPGESVVFTETSPAGFRAEWSLPASVKVLGPYTNNLGRADMINIFDASNALADRLTYGDQAIPGTIRTQNQSGNPMTLAALGADNVAQWELSTVGDVHGSFASANFDVGNPGAFNVVPEPATLALAALAGLAVVCRGRKAVK